MDFEKPKPKIPAFLPEKSRAFLEERLGQAKTSLPEPEDKRGWRNIPRETLRQAVDRGIPGAFEEWERRFGRG